MKGLKQNKNAIIWRIKDVKDVIPELVMFINPANLDCSYQQIINETRTLGGFVEEFWGEQLLSLTASGTTGLFYDDNGLTNENAKNSEAYQNFLRLVNIYKNNGKQYDTNSTKIIATGTVCMSYRECEYEGFFENFVMRELADKPFSIEYDFSFKVTRKLGGLLIDNGNFTKAKKS